MRSFTDTTFAELREQGVEMLFRAPWIMPNHIDGPLLHFSDGQLHWLTLWERIQFRYGWTDAAKLQKKLRPRLSAEIGGARRSSWPSRALCGIGIHDWRKMDGTCCECGYADPAWR